MGSRSHIYMPLFGKKILFGVSGGIAAFKAAEFVRELKKSGAEVKVILTENAQKFISPLTFSALSGNNCFSSLFDQYSSTLIPHIELSDWADVLLCLPATANIISRLANGMADDLLTTTFLSFKGPKLIFPSMNPNMFESHATQENIAKLKSYGYEIIEPTYGRVVCGHKGKGKLVNFDTVRFYIQNVLWPKKLKGKKVLITTGPTREPIDPIRFISNRSSGKMGFCLAESALLRGAQLTLICGPTKKEPKEFIPHLQVETASEMASQVFNLSDNMEIIIMAAAISDYAPSTFLQNKLKKSQETLKIELKKTTDILKELGKKKQPNQILVGFCAETENLIENAFKKLQEKRLDLIVANNVMEKGAGFDTDTNKVYLIDTEENIEELPLLPKEEVAERIFDKIEKIIEKAFN